MDSDDARYERPCRWLLAVAAGIHWLAAALMIRDHVASRLTDHDVNMAETVLRLLALT